MPSIVQRPAKPRARSSLFKWAPSCGRLRRAHRDLVQRIRASRHPRPEDRHRRRIRKGIEDAISVKKNATSIVEAVSAEDIGKLPDVSIGESISRLPGLSAQRVAGRAQVISVRTVARLCHHLAQRPGNGQHRRQPKCRIRPIPVGTAERRNRV